MKYSCYFNFLLLLSSIICTDSSKEESIPKSEYYDLIEEIIQGVDHYETLLIARSATSKEIKKAFHTLSLTYHPDKIKSNFPTKTEQEEALKIYFKIQRAYEVLSSTTLKLQYDQILDEGVSWKDRHYHRYVHRYWKGAPEHDPLVVLLYVSLGATVFHFYYVRYRYNRIVRMAKQTRKYKEKKNELQAESTSNSELGTEEPAILFHGYSAPVWYEILPIVVILKTWSLIKSSIQWFKRRNLSEEEKMEEYKKMVCEKYGWTEEEYQEQVEKSKRKRTQFLNSTKMKRYVRYMKQKRAGYK